MAEYDGSIRIGTDIETKNAEKELKSLESSISKTADKIASLRSKMDALKDTRIPTEEFNDLMKEASEAEKELDKMIAKNSELAKLDEKIKKLSQSSAEYATKMKEVAELKIQTEAYATIQKQIDASDKKLSGLIDKQEKFLATGGKKKDSAYKRMVYDAEQLQEEIAELEGREKRLVDAGKAFTLGTDTEQYKDLSAKYESVNQELEKSKDLYDEIKQAQRESAIKLSELVNQIKQLKAEGKDFTLGSDTEEFFEMSEQMERLNQQMQTDTERQTELQSALAAEEERLAKIKANATVSDQNIIDLLERRKQIIVDIADMERAGVGLGYTQYENANRELENINERIKEYKDNLSEIPEKFSRMVAAAKKAFSAIRTGFSMIGNIGKKAFSGIFSMAKKAFSAITGGAKQSNNSFSGGLKTILRYGLGIRSLYALFNKIRSGIQEGFTNLMGYSDSFANSIQSVKNSMSTLGNQIAGAFRPIVEMVIPWINSLINALSTAMTYVAQFIATLTGSSTFTRAKQIQDKYNQSLSGTAKAADKARGALAKFDDLDVLQKQEDASGSGTGELDASDMFEEVEVDDKWKNIAELFREMWENSDFYALGKLLGEKLKEGLESIDWAPIKETAKKIGKSLATFINGGIEVDGLANSIGQTIGQAINTVIIGINTFLDNTHWDSVGKFIGDGLNGLVDSINFGDIGHFFAEKWNTIFETIGEAAKTFNWENFGASLAESFNTWIADFNWAENGAYLGELIKGILDTLITFIEETDWQELGNNVAEFIGNIDWSGIVGRLFEGIGAVLGGLAAFLLGLIEEAWNSVVEWMHETFFEDGELTMESFQKGIIKTLLKIDIWIYEHIFEPFIEGFKKAFGINSEESKVMEENGEILTESLLEGMKGPWPDVVSWILDKIQWLKDKLDEMLSLFNSMKSVNLSGFSTGGAGGALSQMSLQAASADIPALATGAVIRGGNPFMAILGDQSAGKTNIEAPLATIEQALDNVMNRRGGSERVPVNINLNYDGETFARLSIPDILSELDRRGYNVDVLGVT